MSKHKHGSLHRDQVKNLAIALQEVLREAAIHQKRIHMPENKGARKQAAQLQLVDSLERTCNLISLAMNTESDHIDKASRAMLQTTLDEARRRFFEQATGIVLKKLDDIGNTAQRTLDNYPEYALGIGRRLKRQFQEITQAFETVLGKQSPDTPLGRCLEEIGLKVEAVYDIELREGMQEFAEDEDELSLW
jgi:hypothetical protein